MSDSLTQRLSGLSFIPTGVLKSVRLICLLENLSYCAERKIRLSGPALGRPKKDEICDKKQDYIDESERVEVERKFRLAKRKCGIGLIVTRLKETTCHCLAMSVLLLNLRKIGKVLLTEILMLV